MKGIRLKETLILVLAVIAGGVVACLLLGHFVIYPFAFIALPFVISKKRKNG